MIQGMRSEIKNVDGGGVCGRVGGRERFVDIFSHVKKVFSYTTKIDVDDDEKSRSKTTFCSVFRLHNLKIHFDHPQVTQVYPLLFPLMLDREPTHSFDRRSSNNNQGLRSLSSSFLLHQHHLHM